MKLVLINPPEIPGYVSDRDKAGGIGVARPRGPAWRTRYLPPTPPMDLLYAAAIAERDGVPLALLDCIGRRWGSEQLLRALAAENPSHIGVRVSMPSLDEDLALVEGLATACPNAKVFLFGHASQTTHDRWLSTCHADAVFFGEVEALLLPYLHGAVPEGLAGKILKPGATATFCGSWAYAEDLDALPMPAWHLVDIARYSPTGRVEDFVFYILTSRGCPKGCSMCPYFVHQGKQWRFRSVDHVIAEFEHLRGLGARLIQTRDPNISWRKKHLLAIAERLKERPLFRISTETDLEALGETDLVALKEAGFVRIMTGVESVDESILKEIHQNGNALKRSLDNMAICQRLGIGVTGFFIVGSLQETWQSVRNTLATAKVLPCNYSVSLMTPYFGTEMRAEFVKAGYHREATSFKQYNGYSGLVRTKGLDYGDVVLAHAWAAAELELVVRERSLAETPATRQPLQWLRVFKQRALVSTLRGRVGHREIRSAHASLPETA